jgi:hypothetical protein
MQNSNNYGATLAEVPELLKARKPFHTGTLSGESAEIGYIVKSYGVIIACTSRLDTGYVFDDAYNHSKTTSKHANIVKKAWGL